MDIEQYRGYCMAKKGVTEEFPFGEETLVYKVMGKMFALTSLVDFSRITLKVDPESGAEMRERFPSVQAAYHMNKKHWIMVMLDGSLPDKLLYSWIDTSYALVTGALTKSQQSALEKL